MLYKNMRRLVEGIIDETNLQRISQQNGFLRDFKDRRAPNFFFIEEKITFQVECLYKSLKDTNQDPMISEEAKQGPPTEIQKSR